MQLFRIGRNHLLKRGGLLNGQKFCNLVLYMALGGMLTLSCQLDLESGRSNSEFDTAAASIRERTSESIERRIGAACHIIQKYKIKPLVSRKNIERKEQLTCFGRHPAMEFALGLINIFEPASFRDCAIIVLISS